MHVYFDYIYYFTVNTIYKCNGICRSNEEIRVNCTVAYILKSLTYV